MADVRPFAGLRFDPGRLPLSRVLCPPYDVIDAAQARALRRGAHNAVHLELPEGHGAAKYRRAVSTLRRWLVEGVLRRDPEPSYYVCEETFPHGGRVLRRLGFLAALGVTPRACRDILEHERTLPKPKADRLRILRAVGLNISPIFGVFPDPRGRVRRLLRAVTARAPEARGALSSGVRYRLWRLSEPRRVRELSAALASRQVLIADGHHRFEVARAYHRLVRTPESEALLAYLCPEEEKGLVVLPTHRIVPRDGLSSPVASSCRVVQCRSLKDMLRRVRAAANPYAFGFYERSYGLALPDLRGCRSGLGVEWLERHLLRDIPHDRILYTPDPAKASAQARRLGGSAVFVKPAGVAQIHRAVRAVGLLPPKSTYFYPKIATGLVFKKA